MMYECDPHQQWADEGWGDAPEPDFCRDCSWYDEAPFANASCGICMLSSFVSGGYGDVTWVRDTDSCGEFTG